MRKALPKGLKLAITVRLNCHFDSPLNDTRMFRMLLECCKAT